MHPADQFDAFKTLADDGIGHADIGARFGATVPSCAAAAQARSRVSPKLIALYRKDAMTLDCLMAFAVSDEHKQQEKIWADLPDWCAAATPTRSATRSPRRMSRPTASWRVSSPLRPTRPRAARCCATCSTPTMQAGFTDAALVNRLAQRKARPRRGAVRAEGWKWVEIIPDLSWDTLRAFDRIHPTPTKQQQAALDELQAERDKTDDEDSEEAEKLFAEIEESESEIAFTAEEKAKQRCHRQHHP